MFDLDQAIEKWRQQMLAAGIKTPVPLDELESHLREDISALVSAGESEAQAFQLAVSRFGSSSSVTTEFSKIKIASCAAVKIGSFVWIGAIILLSMVGLRNMFAGKLGLLWFAHGFSLTAGYGAAFLTAGFGICYLCWQRTNKLTPVRRHALGRAILLFSHLSAGLIVVGFVLGVTWNRLHHGIYWNWNPREIGGLCASVWFIAVWLSQRFGQTNERTMMFLSTVGSVIVSLTWFGSIFIVTESFWPLAVFVGINLVFVLFVIGMADDTEAIES